MRQPQYQPLVVVVAAAAAGIVADRYWPLAAGLWWFAALTALPCWFLAWRRMRLRTAAFILLAAVAATAAAWHHCCWYLFDKDDLAQFAGAAPQPVCIEAVALSTPRPIPRPPPNPMRNARPAVRLDVAVDRYSRRWRWRPAAAGPGWSSRPRCPRSKPATGFGSSPISPGRAASESRRVRSPAISAPTASAASFGRSMPSRYPLAPGSSWSPRRLLEQVRMHGNRLFQRYLAAAIGRGRRCALGHPRATRPRDTEAFVETGTIHLLVIAGLHLGILAGAVLLVVRRLPIPRGWALRRGAVHPRLHAAGRCPAAGGPRHRAGAGPAARLRGPPAADFNVLAAAALVVLALNPADLFPPGPNCRSSAWPA